MGEGKLKLDDKIESYKIKRRQVDVFSELEDKVASVQSEYKGGVEVVRMLICHFATKGFIKMAEERGVIVVQSFEW